MGVLEDTQPFFYGVPDGPMAHNGNVKNYDQLRDSLRTHSIHSLDLMSANGIEPALCEFADVLMEQRCGNHTLDDAEVAAQAVHDRVLGAYSSVAALMLDVQPTLMGLWDRRGFAPAQ